MRVIIIAIVALFGATTVSAQSQRASMEEAWNRANTAYVNANYQESITIYDSIVKLGYVSDKLYYNLGNAYFKAGMIGQAILNYNRALRLNPSDGDMKHNLKVANSHVVDKIEAIPEFFLSTWFRAWRDSMSSNALAAWSLIMAGVALSAVLLYLFSHKMKLRRVGFYLTIFSILCTVIFVLFAVQRKKEIENPSMAIVMRKAIAVKSSPNQGSTDIFILHEGTKVEVVGELEQWREITISDGNKGWIEAGAIELID